MESIAPPLALLFCVKRSLEKGKPVRHGVLNYIRQNGGDFSGHVTQWLGLIHQGKDTREFTQSIGSFHRRILLQILERGLRGEPVYNTLLQLENELVEACQDELSDKIARLPFILLIPLLLFQFPAFLMLLFGPLLQNFFHSLGGQ